MRSAKMGLVAFLLLGLTGALFGCGSASNEVKAENQVATVQRGNISVDITAAGNLALSHTEDLPIDLFYAQGVKGTVGEVLVREGDAVTAGQVLATLDTAEWDKQMKALEKALTTAQRNLTAKEVNVTDAERQVAALERQVTAKEKAITDAEHQVTAKELAVNQAQVDLRTAEYNLGQIADVKKAQDAVDNAELNLRAVKMVLRGDLGGGLQTDFSYWSQQEILAEEELAAAQEDLADILHDSSITMSEDVALDVAKKQLALAQKQMALGDAQIAVEDARQAVADAQQAADDAKYAVKKAQLTLDNANLDIEDTRQAVEDARSNLDEAKSLSPIITAPFAGFITKVNVAGGDEVLNGTVAVQIADPNKFEADILVSEMDIMQVKVGGQAQVQVAALPGRNIPATVTHISPTATIQSGVVNYRVTVEVQPLAVAAVGQSPGPSANTTSRPGPGTFSQRQSGAGAAQGRVPAAVSENFQLREGLTVTVSLIVQQKTDVLLVPNTAITTKGNQTYVQVVTPGGTNEERVVQTGISDWQNIEVISGLNEGDKVVVPQNTAPTTTAAQRQQQPPGGMVPNIGRILR